MVDQMSLDIAGLDYPNKKGPPRRFELAMCSPGEAVALKPEPKNPADPQAVAIYSCRGIQLGYVRAERAPLIRTYLSRARITAAVFQCVTEHGALIRIALDGAELRLPPPQPKSSEAPDFYPDYDQGWD